MAKIDTLKKESAASWAVDSWRSKTIRQQPVYPDAQKVSAVEKNLAGLPPLVSFDEIRSLKHELSEAAMGRAFLLQGGDCAESFAEFNETNLQSFFRALIQMTIALMYGAGSPVVKVGRIAGQFAKPRSDATEKKGSE